MDPLVTVVGLDHIVLTTPDVERALAFYTDVLGLDGVRVEEWRRGDAPFPSVRIDATTLIDLALGERSGANLDHLCLRIDPFDEAAICAHLATPGIDQGPVHQIYASEGSVPSLYFPDP